MRQALGTMVFFGMIAAAHFRNLFTLFSTSQREADRKTQ
jgi:hypothetical protein